MHVHVSQHSKLITHGHGKGWDVIIDIQEVDPEAADCGSHLRPETSLVISNHCQLHTQKLEGLAFMHSKPIPYYSRSSFLAKLSMHNIIIIVYTSVLK